MDPKHYSIEINKYDSPLYTPTFSDGDNDNNAPFSPILPRSPVNNYRSLDTPKGKEEDVSNEDLSGNKDGNRSGGEDDGRAAFDDAQNEWALARELGLLDEGQDDYDPEEALDRAALMFPSEDECLDQEYDQNQDTEPSENDEHEHDSSDHDDQGEQDNEDVGANGDHDDEEDEKDTSSRDEEEQYKQKCMLDGCDNILHIDMPIYIMTRDSDGKELTVCQPCRQDQSLWTGWTDADDEERSSGNENSQ